MSIVFRSTDAKRGRADPLPEIGDEQTLTFFTRDEFENEPDLLHKLVTQITRGNLCAVDKKALTYPSCDTPYGGFDDTYFWTSLVNENKVDVKEHRIPHKVVAVTDFRTYTFPDGGTRAVYRIETNAAEMRDSDEAYDRWYTGRQVVAADGGPEALLAYHRDTPSAPFGLPRGDGIVVGARGRAELIAPTADREALPLENSRRSPPDLVAVTNVQRLHGGAISRADFVLLVRQRGAIVGFCLMQAHGTSFYIDVLCAKKASGGAGSRMLQRAEEEARARGFESLSLRALPYSFERTPEKCVQEANNNLPAYYARRQFQFQRDACAPDGEVTLDWARQPQNEADVKIHGIPMSKCLRPRESRPRRGWRWPFS